MIAPRIRVLDFSDGRVLERAAPEPRDKPPVLRRR